MCRGFFSISNEWPLQDHLYIETVILTQGSVSLETWPMNLQSKIFPRVTNKWPFQDYLPNKTIDLKLSPRRPKQWTCRAKSSLLPSTNGLLKTIFQVKLSGWKLCLPGDQELWMCRAEQIFSRVNNEQPFQDHFLNKTTTSTQNTVSQGDLNNEYKEASPASLTLGLFKTIFQVKLTAWRICLQETWTINIKCLPQCHQWMVFSRPSSN